VTVGDACKQAFAPAATSAQARHLGVQSGLVDEDQAGRIEIGLVGEPDLARRPHIVALLLSRMARSRAKRSTGSFRFPSNLFHRDPASVEEPPQRGVTGAQLAVLSQTVAHLVQRDVNRLFDQAKKVGLMRIKLGADRMTLLARRPLPGPTPPPHPPDRCGHTNPEPGRRLPRR